MSQFTFNFGGEDGEESQDTLQTAHNAAADIEKPAVPVEEHSLENLIKGLPSAISYSAPPKHTGLPPRRTLSDVRVQLMAESELDTPIPGLDSDLETDVYEGGFKTWECSVDLAGYLSNPDSAVAIGDGQSCLELGCGSALPALSVFSQVLARKIKHFTLILADYNAIVLSTVTLPNLLLSYARLQHPTALSATGGDSEGDGDGDLELSEGFVSSFFQALAELDFRVRFLSGPWGAELLSRVRESGRVGLVLASETIYAPSSIEPFSSLVLELLRGSKNDDQDGCTTLIAAKKVYFGVGGGIEEFNRSLTQKGGRLEQRFSSEGGVGRGIWQVYSR